MKRANVKTVLGVPAMPPAFASDAVARRPRTFPTADRPPPVQILANIAAAAVPNARIIVVDSNRRSVPRDDLGLRADLLMAAPSNGGLGRSRPRVPSPLTQTQFC